MQIGLWPSWPEGVGLGQNVDVDAEDPAAVTTLAYRQCCGAKKDGGRCRGRSLNDGLLCPVHEGRADPLLAVRARVEAAAERRSRSEGVVALQRLGTRAVIAQTLVEEAASVRATVRTLLTAAAGGDVAAAKACIPYFNQGLGMPTERVEHKLPSLADLEGLETAQLEEMVARGREQRLRAVEPQAETG